MVPSSRQDSPLWWSQCEVEIKKKKIIWLERFERMDLQSQNQTWVRLKIFLIRINIVSESFDSTQLMTRNGFTGIDSNQPTSQIEFQKFYSN